MVWEHRHAHFLQSLYGKWPFWLIDSCGVWLAKQGWPLPYDQEWHYQPTRKLISHVDSALHGSVSTWHCRSHRCVPTRKIGCVCIYSNDAIIANSHRTYRFQRWVGVPILRDDCWGKRLGSTTNTVPLMRRLYNWNFKNFWQISKALM